jgi:hypothetical protein
MKNSLSGYSFFLRRAERLRQIDFDFLLFETVEHLSLGRD